ncbi:MAG: hypothetical protein OXR68_00120 [Alphaproteobacteria bacterium]|nr:hypothetical protein [Alphaproteobacteria bacterium]MDD9919016.1 hypothetical protein [Alphaproteobacteria bacterium]
MMESNPLGQQRQSNQSKPQASGGTNPTKDALWGALYVLGGVGVLATAFMLWPRGKREETPEEEAQPEKPDVDEAEQMRQQVRKEMASKAGKASVAARRKKKAEAKGDE